ncbi:MAG TPA: TlpA disulfide reductase family protein [Solirubrobacterales bacterium]|jgi:cytochrome c biogenesis protein CcmG/thiol:disulfide interchange protein DsbE|nr:TlpA disulfide reductase family protein [Solirubrobacterales bacterium]
MARKSIISLVATVFVIAAVTGCGSEDGSGSVKPATSLDDVRPDLRDAPKPLVSISNQSLQLLPGGAPAFFNRIKSLKGNPVVVNKWGSWCGPCRAEFPLFQKAAKRDGAKVAFLGVNILDSPEAAREFLTQRPVPYPSYVDDKLVISKQLRPVQGAPSTGFWDRSGKLVYVKIGEYKSQADLDRDIAKYALAQ